MKVVIRLAFINNNFGPIEPFSVCFNVLKLRYSEYDESISSKKVINSDDKINVFINLESIFKNLSMITDLEKKLILQRDYKVILISNILNLAAHYKRFFKSNGLDTKVYLYHTDFGNTEYSQYKYNEDYRTFYHLKYNDNPKFVMLTESLKNDILPQVKTYCDYIKDVYYVSSKNIEGSLVPYIISKSTPTRKNFIIGSEWCDTLYTLIPNFINHYVHRGVGYNSVCSTVKEYIKELTKKKDNELETLTDAYSSYGAYCSLLSVLGDRKKSIDGMQGIGPITLKKKQEEALDKKIITKETTSPDLLKKMFPDDGSREEFSDNYYCTSILHMYDELTDTEKMSVINQLVDHYDINTLLMLNKTTFANHPLILESLTM